MSALTAEDIKVGKTYRAKRPCKVFWNTETNAPGFNDRLVLYVDEARVQYDGPAVGFGRHYPMVPIEKFLAWASHEVAK